MSIRTCIASRYDTSFGIYICAGPIQQTLLCLIPALTPLWLSSIAFAIVLPLAFASWCFIEKPALAFRPTLVGALKRRAPAFAFRAGKLAFPRSLSGLVAAKV
jgi:peptidoglycan/LPS O-acetylase OafA/YrhL